jgi:hypothetical protein
MNLQSEPPQDLSTLDQRYNALRDKKIAAEANLETCKGALETLKQEARETYQTDDLDTLRRRLQEMEQDNQRKRSEYQQHLTTIENQLAEVDAEHTKASKQGAEG